MNVKLVPFIIFMPAVVLLAQAMDSGSFSRQPTGSVAPQIWGARDFTNVDWRTVRDEDSGRPPARVAARDDDGAGPFTREEARDLRSVWHTIRDAENFADIDWRSVGLSRAPGDRDARRFMAQDWGSLRRAENFDDIDWRAEYRRR